MSINDEAPTVTNVKKRFRECFTNLNYGATPEVAQWAQSWTNQGTGILARAGNAGGSSYLKISMCPFLADSEFEMLSTETFKIPNTLALGLSASTRILGQELEVSLVQANDNNVGYVKRASVAPSAISGTISVTSNVATVVTATPHGLKGNDRLIIYGNADSRMNIGPITVTSVDSETQFTVALTIANGTYGSGGFVQLVDRFSDAYNAIGFIFDTTWTATHTLAARRNGEAERTTTATTSSLTAAQGTTVAYSDAFNANGITELYTRQLEAFFRSSAADQVSSSPTGVGRLSVGIPDEDVSFKIKIRGRNHKNLTTPIARIVSIAKTGTTTATVVTDVAHNLSTTSFVQIYGVLDQTNFPNLTATTQVSSIVDATTFTIVIGGAVTASSTGGAVWLNHGASLAPGIVSQVVQSVSRTSNVMTFVGSASWSGILPGETIHIYGCNATSLGLYDGAYKVLRVSTTSLQVESIGADFGSVGGGGAVIRRTDYRVHLVNVSERRMISVDIANQHGGLDAVRALPVAAVGTATVQGSVAQDSGLSSTGQLFPMGARASTSNPTSMSASGDAVYPLATMIGVLIEKPYSIPELDLAYASTGAITNTTDVAIAAAAGAGLRRYATAVQVQNTNATATEVVLKDGSTVIWRVYLPASMTAPVGIPFPSPLKTTANTALNFACITTGASVYVNVQGYTGP